MGAGTRILWRQCQWLTLSSLQQINRQNVGGLKGGWTSIPHPSLRFYAAECDELGESDRFHAWAWTQPRLDFGTDGFDQIESHGVAIGSAQSGFGLK